MATSTNNAANPIGPREDNTPALHALLAYSASVLLIIFLGSRLQLYNLNLGLLVTEVAFIALPAGIVLFANRRTGNGNLFSIPHPRQISLTVVIGVCAVVIAVYKGIATRKVLAGVDTSGTDVAGGVSPLLLILLAPLCEELLFRPVVQKGLARHWSNRTAVLLTALLFALFHLSVLRFAETFVIGCLAGIVFLKTRNLWCPVAVHFLCNALGPMLWRNAPHLHFLLNPGTSIGLACLALAGCYYLGEPSPAPLTGLRQRLRWAAFGAPESLQTAHKRSRQVALLAGSIVVALMVLLGYGHSVMMRQLNEQKVNSNYVVSEKDEWTVVSPNEIRARSALAIQKAPETCEDLILRLPFRHATLRAVRVADNDLPFSRLKGQDYRVDVSSPSDVALPRPITVLWGFPLASLTEPDKGYRTPLRSLVASKSLSIALTIEEGSGFRFIRDSALHTAPIFSMTCDNPKIDYGSCGMNMEKGDRHNNAEADGGK